MISHAYSAAIFCRDQDESIRFWTEKCGFTVLGDYPMGGGPRWIEVAPPGAQTRFILHTPEGMESRIGTFSNIILTCDDINKTYEEMAAKGVPFKEKPSVQFWGWWAEFQDPDGNTYGLSQSTPPQQEQGSSSPAA